jgi:hypothetical protein
MLQRMRGHVLRHRLADRAPDAARRPPVDAADNPRVVNLVEDVGIVSATRAM